jgi:hypothetical protein
MKKKIKNKELLTKCLKHLERMRKTMGKEYQKEIKESIKDIKKELLN